MTLLITRCNNVHHAYCRPPGTVNKILVLLIGYYWLLQLLLIVIGVLHSMGLPGILHCIKES